MAASSPCRSTRAGRPPDSPPRSNASAERPLAVPHLLDHFPLHYAKDIHARPHHPHRPRPRHRRRLRTRRRRRGRRHRGRRHPDRPRPADRRGARGRRRRRRGRLGHRGRRAGGP
ncbi:hypothetical protein CURTO8I2_80092 [Curtobacterium sp. 8I-2]|nr:hypothetical protein CURTO8I2_80092 [Curtobacterium sp. 8I-2]